MIHLLDPKVIRPSRGASKAVISLGAKQGSCPEHARMSDAGGVVAQWAEAQRALGTVGIVTSGPDTVPCAPDASRAEIVTASIEQRRDAVKKKMMREPGALCDVWQTRRCTCARPRRHRSGGRRRSTQASPPITAGPSSAPGPKAALARRPLTALAKLRVPHEAPLAIVARMLEHATPDEPAAGEENALSETQIRLDLVSNRNVASLTWNPTPSPKEATMARVPGFVRVAALAAPLFGCGWFGNGGGQSWPLQSAATVPAASGQVTVSQQDEQNHVVDVKVEHLAHPSDAFPGTSSYVVWLIPTMNGGTPENLGVLQLDSDLKGHIEAHTPYRSFRLVITAEERPNVTAPSDKSVLTTSIALPS